MDEATLEYYEQNAATIAPGYETVSAGVSALFPFVFKPGQRVLDIGAGSGRDMARLLSLGIDAFGIEPSDSMRKAAVAAHPDLSARLFAGHIPGGLPLTLPGPWDGIMLSAVIMHIPDAELFDVALELREQLAVGGKLLVSAPETRPDVSPGASRDNRGRLMIVRSPTQLRLLFERLGFELENQWTSADSTGRPFLWTTLLFRRSADSPGGGALGRVASIINADRKVATYKLALIRALCEIAMTSWASVSWEAGGVVSVPLALVAERWVRYYWPLMGSGSRSRDADEPSVRFPQINGEGKGAKPIAFRSVLSELVNECRPLGGLTAFARMQLEARLPPAVGRLYVRALRTVGSTIVRGPVQFAGNAQGKPEFSFQPGTQGTGRILVRGDIWREFSLLGHWICDAVILRWSEMTARLSEGGVQAGTVINLLLQSAEPYRQDPAIREFYTTHRDELRCTWTDKRPGAGLDVDHAIPFAFWQASPAWNLLPAAPSVNNAKRDRLPTAALVRRREEAIVSCWRLVHGAFPERFLRDATGLLGAASGRDWERPLLAGFVEAIEYTASMRGADRWEP